MSAPAVTVVMPCFNAAGHLDRSIGSLQGQESGDWELVAVDDGSSDTTWQRLQDYAARDARIRPLRQANAGAAAARNTGLKAATGRSIAFLDSDDSWHPSFLRLMREALDAAPEVAIVYCGWQNIGLGAARDRPYVPPDYEQGDKIASLVRSCPWPIHGALTRAGFIQAAGGFDETLSSCMDYDLWLRIAALHPVRLVPQVLAYYHHHGSGQITSNRARIALNHLRAQTKFLQAHPDVHQALGRARARELTFGELMARGYESYWRRDLQSARTIFRVLMRHGFGRPQDWLHMIPALLPLAWHQRLLSARDRSART